MHDCGITQEKLIDLIFDEVDPASRESLLAEINRCPDCLREYQSMSQAMQTVDRAIEATTPPESFWPVYETRLRERLADASAFGFWRRWVEKLSGFLPQQVQLKAAFALGLLTLIVAGWMLLGHGNRTPDTGRIADVPKEKTQPSPKPSQPVQAPDLIVKTSEVSGQKRPSHAKPSPRRKDPVVKPPFVETPAETEIAVNTMPAPSEATSILGPDAIRHFEKAQMLLRSFRNSNDQDPATDLNYERQASRKLVYQNILLRRQAEAKGFLPAEEMLGQLEPLLLDIANLPEKASRDEVKSIKDRIARQELVAALTPYSSAAMAYNPAQN
jgi:hypothetical protein